MEQARVAAAAQFLVQTQWTLERIAERSGFRSVDALQRAFRRGHGVTPRAYRERERDRQSAAAHFTGQQMEGPAESSRKKPG
jgi:transcriptional regulator GlxA family with amidase domain